MSQKDISHIFKSSANTKEKASQLFQTIVKRLSEPTKVMLLRILVERLGNGEFHSIHMTIDQINGSQGCLSEVSLTSNATSAPNLDMLKDGHLALEQLASFTVLKVFRIPKMSVKRKASQEATVPRSVK